MPETSQDVDSSSRRRVQRRWSYDTSTLTSRFSRPPQPLRAETHALARVLSVRSRQAPHSNLGAPSGRVVPRCRPLPTTTAPSALHPPRRRGAEDALRVGGCGSRAGYRAPPSPVPREKTTARRRHGLQGDSCALLWASWEHDDVDAANAEFVEKCLAPPFAYRVAAFEMFESRAAEQSMSCTMRVL